MLKRNDLILIVVVILICLGVFAFLNLTQKAGVKLVITEGGKVYDTLSLQEDTVYTVKGKNEEYNTFKITNGNVDMIDASCPDKLCVKQQNIKNNHETIVCLPNKVVLEVIGGEGSDVDMIAK